MSSRCRTDRVGEMGRTIPLLFLCGLLLLAGCAKKENLQERMEKWQAGSTHVIVHDTVYYRVGPQQAFPPEGRFETGTRVEIIENAGSYTQVRSEDGREGYVSTDALQPLKDGE